MTSKLIADTRGSAGYLILNAPDRRNALSFDMWSGITPIIERFSQDPKVRAVVVTGAGSQAFSAGADIGEFEANRATGEAAATYDRATQHAIASLQRCPKPVIAAIRGICFGGGFALALGCDTRLAADDARFCIPAAKLGIGYGVGATAALVQRLGPATTAELLFTARVYSAAEALAAGIVQRIAPPGAFDAMVDDYVATLAANAPLSIAASKSAIRVALDEAGARAQAEADLAACMASDDYKEGRRAFLEKRKPRFEGR